MISWEMHTNLLVNFKKTGSLTDIPVKLPDGTDGTEPGTEWTLYY
jgi:flagellar hook protein FlgE